MDQHVIRKSRDGQVLEQYLLRVPTKADVGFYLQDMTFRSFFREDKPRRRFNEHESVVYTRHSLDDISLEEFNNIKRIGNMWDLYKEIDYDYNRQKFNKR